jgi:hypothetical protein
MKLNLGASEHTCFLGSFCWTAERSAHRAKEAAASGGTFVRLYSPTDGGRAETRHTIGAHVSPLGSLGPGTASNQ